MAYHWTVYVYMKMCDVIFLVFHLFVHMVHIVSGETIYILYIC